MPSGYTKTLALFLTLSVASLGACGTDDEVIDDAKVAGQEGADDELVQQGEQGEPGPAGPAGADGSDGANGANGTNGNDGANGSAGASWLPLGVTATALTNIGGNALNAVGTAAASPMTDAMYVRHTSAATTNSRAGVRHNTLAQTRGIYRPKLTALIRTDANISQRRIWVALTSAQLTGTNGTGALAARYVGVRYSTSASDTNWQCASGDGATGSVVDTGVVVAASTPYLIEVDWSTDGTLICTVNGVATTKTTNLDVTQTANLGLNVETTTLAATAAIHLTAYIRLKYNGNDF